MVKQKFNVAALLLRLMPELYDSKGPSTGGFLLELAISERETSVHGGRDQRGHAEGVP